MPRWLSVWLLLFIQISASDAQAPRLDRIEIVEWGLYQHDLLSTEAAPDTATGTTNLVKNLRLQHVTTTVPALVGMKFGFRYRIVGSPPGASVNLKFVTRFPGQGLKNPAKSRTFLQQEAHVSQAVGAVGYRGYTFDYDWEVEAGPWTLEVWHEGRKLAEKTFIVTRLVSSADAPR